MYLRHLRLMCFYFTYMLLYLSILQTFASLPLHSVEPADESCHFKYKGRNLQQYTALLRVQATHVISISTVVYLYIVARNQYNIKKKSRKWALHITSQERTTTQRKCLIFLSPYMCNASCDL